MTLIQRLNHSLTRPAPIVSLAVLRILFGLLMCGAAVRFMLKGWVEQLYIAPGYYFSYYGFEFIKPLPGWAMYGLFILMALTAFLVALGWRYRLNIILFFLTFTYVEFVDKANYLNHYYFVSMMALLLCVLPAGRAWSMDVLRRPELRLTHVPRWVMLAVKVQLGSVYFFGGVAKIKWEWLFEAQPLRIWLSANTDLPLIGPLMDDVWAAYAISWIAMVFDLTVPFFLYFRRTQLYAYAVVLVFHILTARLFYIGMFPYFMMVYTLVFFPPAWHRVALDFFRRTLRLPARLGGEPHFGYALYSVNPSWRRPLAGAMGVFFAFQLLMPFRYLLYPGYLLWTEQGFRFAWHIMIIEKTAHIEFNVTDPASGRSWVVMPQDHLTTVQAKQMSTQPDMILQFAHFIEDYNRKRSYADLEVRADCFASLNGKPSRRLIDPSVDLTRKHESFAHKDWVIPYDKAPGILDNVAIHKN